MLPLNSTLIEMPMFKSHHSAYRVVPPIIATTMLILCLMTSSCTEKPSPTPIVPSTVASTQREAPIPKTETSTVTPSPSIAAGDVTPGSVPATLIPAIPTPTGSAVSRPTPRPASPTATLQQLNTPTQVANPHPSPQIIYSLILTRHGDLHIYHSADTPAIQIKWIHETYDAVQVSLFEVTGINLNKATVYLLGQAEYEEILSEVVGIDVHPEWTQGVAYRPDPSYEGVVYMNKAVGALWGSSTSDKEKNIWRGENVQRTTRKVAAHELTHLALMPYEVPSWLNEGIAKYMENTVLLEELVLEEKLRLRYSLRAKALNGSLPSIQQLNAKNWIIGATNYADLASLYDLSTGIIWSTVEVTDFTNAHDLILQPPSDISLEILVLSVLNEWLAVPLPEETSAVVLCRVAKHWLESDKLMDEWNEVIARNSFDGWDHVSFLEALDSILTAVKRTTPQTQAEPLRTAFLEYLTAFRLTVFYLLQGENSVAEASRIKANGHLATAHTLLESTAELYLPKPCEGSIGIDYTRLSE